MVRKICESNCPVCLNKQFKEFMDFGEVPRADCFLENPNQTPNMINLSFEYCSNCAFIRQKSFQEHDYINDLKKTGHTLMDYCWDAVKYLKNEGVGKNDLIVDVGCNDGAFLELLSESGLENALGIEPSFACAELCKFRGYRIEDIYFSREESKKIKKIYGEASAVVYRHVLEHVENPFNFILAARDLLKEDGKIFIELPDSNNIIYKLNAHELLDQHISYFTPNTLEKFVSRAGFKINEISVKPYMGTNAILLFGSKIYKNKTNNVSFKEDVYACSKFAANWKDLSNKILEKIKKLEKPIICLGASHPQSRFLVFSGVGNYVSQLIDDDPIKIGKYVFVPKPVRIISTKEFIESRPKGTVLHTAFGYDNWAERILDLLNKKIPCIKFSKYLNKTPFNF